MNRSAREGKSVKRFELSNGLDIALYKTTFYYKKGPSNFSDMGPWAHTLLFLGNTLMVKAKLY